MDEFLHGMMDTDGNEFAMKRENNNAEDLVEPFFVNIKTEPDFEEQSHDAGMSDDFKDTDCTKDPFPEMGSADGSDNSVTTTETLTFSSSDDEEYRGCVDARKRKMRMKCKREDSAAEKGCLGRHKKEKPGNEKKLSTSPQQKEMKKKELFICEICGKYSSSKYGLEVHIRTHTGERPFQCALCNKAFSLKINLIIHMRMHSGERPYKCSVCEKLFAHANGLKGHMRLHSGEKPFKCSICNKTSTNKSNLVEHKRLHSGERPYDCSVCNKSFRTRSNLKVYMPIHSGEKPFMCSICNKTSTVRSNLVKHIRLHSVERPYNHYICNTSSRSNGDLKKHT